MNMPTIAKLGRVGNVFLPTAIIDRSAGGVPKGIKAKMPRHPIGGNRRILSQPAQQSGAVLIVSLIMLLLLTIIAAVGMQTTTMEEKMAGNKRDYNLAFQAAESALRAAEAATATITPNDYYTGSKDPIDWTDTKVKTYNAGTLNGLHEAPKYIVQLDAETSGGGADDCPPCEGGTTGGGGTTSWYRITARGTGGTTNAVVTLQSIYKH